MVLYLEIKECSQKQGQSNDATTGQWFEKSLYYVCIYVTDYLRDPLTSFPLVGEGSSRIELWLQNWGDN